MRQAPFRTEISMLKRCIEARWIHSLHESNDNSAAYLLSHLSTRGDAILTVHRPAPHSSTSMSGFLGPQLIDGIQRLVCRPSRT